MKKFIHIKNLIVTNKKEIFFVKNLYEKILNEIFPELNKACDLKFSKRSWRIFIGPWLYRFITVSVDRLNNISFKKKSQKNFVKKDLITKISLNLLRTSRHKLELLSLLSAKNLIRVSRVYQK